jgi:hypothetical protein
MTSCCACGYAFEEGVIKLNQRDLDRWRKIFHNIPNLEAELYVLAPWAAHQDNWFYAVSGALKNIDRKYALERKRREEPPGFY